MANEPAFERVRGGQREFFCRTCAAYTANFVPSFARRRVRQCRGCANVARQSRRHADRPTTVAASLRQRESRAAGGTLPGALTRDEVAAVLSVAGGRSAWPCEHDVGAIGIDKIDADQPLTLANAMPLGSNQIRRRAYCRSLGHSDPMPAVLRSAARWIAAKVANQLAADPAPVT